MLWTAFVVGLAGSLHCAGMCGPLALALPVTGASVFTHFLGRVIYNCGRLFTYAGLGAVFGMAGQTLALAGFQRWLSISVGVALLMGLLFSRRLALATPVQRLVTRLKTLMSAFLNRRSLLALGVLGALTGLLPCGLVYVACAGAATTHGWWQGGVYMIVFGLGTFPMMLAISLSGKLLTPAVRIRLRHAVPVSVCLLSLLLILRGLSLDIPYLSPDLSKGSCACHAVSE